MIHQHLLLTAEASMLVILALVEIVVEAALEVVMVGWRWSIKIKSVGTLFRKTRLPKTFKD